jgi:hypothetical protein
MNSKNSKPKSLGIEIKTVVGSLTQALAGEMAANRYLNGGVERRLADIERRLSAIEPSR